jgi:acyl-CoA thioester hydrolase
MSSGSEVTRIEYLRRFRGGYKGLREEGVDALTLEVYAGYRSAARFDDRLLVHARCTDLRGARFRFEYKVERDGEIVADGWTTHACVSVGDHRPTRVPAWLAEAITAAET